jgi:hypothetical protein
MKMMMRTNVTVTMLGRREDFTSFIYACLTILKHLFSVISLLLIRLHFFNVYLFVLKLFLSGEAVIDDAIVIRGRMSFLSLDLQFHNNDNRPSHSFAPVHSFPTVC